MGLYEYVHDACWKFCWHVQVLFHEHGKILCACLWINLWVWKNFCGHEIMEKFCWVCDVSSWKIFVVMILAM